MNCLWVSTEQLNIKDSEQNLPSLQEPYNPSINPVNPYQPPEDPYESMYKGGLVGPNSPLSWSHFNYA